MQIQTELLHDDVKILNERIRYDLTKVLQKGETAFLTGGAGSGKTHMLKGIASKLKDSVILAPTGISASNVGGQTIHSFFSFPLHLQQPEDVNTKIKNAHLIRKMELLIIDEVSMVNPLLLDCIDTVMQRVRGDSNPFGGCAVLLCGDMAQLPPVIPDKRGSGLSEKEILEKMGYTSKYAFSSKVWQKIQYYFELKGSWRQNEDSGYFGILNQIRNSLLGNQTRSLSQALGEVNHQCVGRNLVPDCFSTLASTNAIVREINMDRLSRLPEPEYAYSAKVIGEWRDDLSRAPRELILKKGAQVICVANDPLKQFVNGSIGKVVDMDMERQSVFVKLGETDRVIEVQPNRWDNWQYAWDDEAGKMSVKSVGHFIQVPLQIGYALTIHSSQGLTLPSVKFITTKLFEKSLSYVALSRCPSMCKLSLSQPLYC